MFKAMCLLFVCPKGCIVVSLPDCVSEVALLMETMKKGFFGWAMFCIVANKVHV